MKFSLQRVAASWCVLMAVALAGVQVFGATHPPLGLFLLFTGVWLFGALMLLLVPAFGAIGTTIYGIIMAVQLFRMHGSNTLNVLIGVGSLVASGLAMGYFLVRRRGLGA